MSETDLSCGAPALPESDAEHRLKSLAKRLAQACAASVDDRRLRATVRTRCYNESLSLLRQIDERRNAERLRHRRLLAAAGAAVVVLALGNLGLLLL